jgi:hypothetical protein
MVALFISANETMEDVLVRCFIIPFVMVMAIMAMAMTEEKYY